MKKYQTVISKITFPNNRVKKGDELIFIGRYYSSILVIPKNEIKNVVNNYYPELVVMSENELKFYHSFNRELPKYSKTLNILLQKEKFRQKNLKK